ncbi:TPA: hypothetical protein MAM28_004496 [Klebsiella pneumoniae]|nr:hypothetical protein [Klebsiella pneumoniae]HDS5146725.1 hypothetical protein [Klebsiella pneumoniae subsp. pneumoniae]
MNNNNVKDFSVNYNFHNSYIPTTNGYVINDANLFWYHNVFSDFNEAIFIPSDELDIKTTEAHFKPVQTDISGDLQLNIVNKKNNISPVDTDFISNKIYNHFIFDEISFDTISKTKYIIDRLINEYGYQQVDYALLNLISRTIFISNDDEKIIKFICLLSSVSVSDIPLSFFTTIVSFYNHKSDSVKEAVIMAVEYWETKDAITYIEMMEPFKRPYLEKYKKNVLTYLKELP